MDASNDRPSLHLNNGSHTREATQRAPFGFIDIEAEGGGACLISVDAIRAVVAAKIGNAPALNLCGLVVDGIAQPITVAHNVREIGRRIDEAQRSAPAAIAQEAIAVRHRAEVERIKYNKELGARIDGEIFAKLDALMIKLNSMPNAGTIVVDVPLDPDTPPPAAVTAAPTAPLPCATRCPHCDQPMVMVTPDKYECIPCGEIKNTPDTAPAGT